MASMPARSRREASKLMGTAHHLTLFCIAALLGSAASQQKCTPRPRGVTDSELEVGNVSSEARPLAPNTCDQWILSPSSIEEHPSCALNSGSFGSFLSFEFWRLDVSGDQPDNRTLVTNVFFLLAKGVQPNVTITGNSIIYSPPRVATGSGTVADIDADSYSRTYHRISVLRNSASLRPGMPTADTWFVTIANLEQRLPVFSYKIRVTCLPSAAEAPCPTPTPSLPPCSGRGACSLPPAGYSGLNRVCLCEDGWGDYDCQRPAPLLPNGGVTNAVIQPNAWAFWQLRVPLPEGGAAALPRPPALLVELNRGGAGGGGAQGTGLAGSSDGGGDPVLLVVPKPASGSNQVPSFLDVSSRADLNSYFLQQNFHYMLLRDPRLFRALLSAPQLSSNTSSANRTADFYVAVYNNIQRFSQTVTQPPQANQVANITLRVRWTDLTLTPAAAAAAAAAQGSTTAPPLCPGNCFGRGTCYDPRDPAAAGTLPPPLLPPLPPSTTNDSGAVKPLDFQCACRADAGGTLCEGAVVRVNVTMTSGLNISQGQVLPGQWKFFIVQLNNQTFDYGFQQLLVRWRVREDRSAANFSAYVNAFLTINEQAFPRDSDFTSDKPFRRGWQLFYNNLAQRSNPPLPLLLKGTDLTPGLSYVFGLYNSEYLRQVPYNTSLEITAAASPPPPRPPRPPQPARALPPQPPGDAWWWVSVPPPEGSGGGGDGGVQRPPPSRARRSPPHGRQRVGSRQLPPAMSVTGGPRNAGRGAPPPAERRRAGGAP